MLNKKYLSVLALLLVFALLPLTNASFAGGNGSPGNPYQVTNWSNLNEVRNNLTASYILNNNLDSGSYCYQETANASHTGDGSCGLNYSGTYSQDENFEPDNTLYDGNWNTFNAAMYGPGEAVSTVTYFPPTTANINGTLWQVKYGITPTTKNIGLNSSCYNVDRFDLKVISRTYEGDSGVRFECYNGTDWLIVNDDSNPSVYNSVMYEEAIIWDVNTKGYPGLGDNWTPIGTYSPSSGRFNGTFNGNGHTISNLIATSAVTGAGLFGGTGTNSQISNLGLINARVTGLQATGSLVGYDYGKIDNCYSINHYINGSSGVGGLVGYSQGVLWVSYENITNSYASGSVYGSGRAGGLVGVQMDNSVIKNSYSLGNVEGGETGGLVGYQDSFGLIEKSYSKTNVIGTDDVGGLVGIQYGNVTDSYASGGVYGNDKIGGFSGKMSGGAVINNSYSTGSVTGSSDVGGLVGYVTPYAIATSYNSYWDTQTSGQATSVTGTGKTTAEMKNITTLGTWNIAATSDDLNNGYPYLGWQSGNNKTWLIYTAPACTSLPVYITYNYTAQSSDPAITSIQDDVLDMISNFFILMPSIGTILTIVILVVGLALLVYYVLRIKNTPSPETG